MIVGRYEKLIAIRTTKYGYTVELENYYLKQNRIEMTGMEIQQEMIYQKVATITESIWMVMELLILRDGYILRDRND